MKDETKAEGTGMGPASDSSFVPHPSSFHRIRLGPPWHISGTTHTRKFGWPRAPDAGERVWLVCEHVPGPAEVRVNDTAVAADANGPFATDITPLLKSRNELSIAAASDGPLGAVGLEVRPSQLSAGANSSAAG